MAAELLQPVGPVVVDKLGELGIAELGELGGMTGTESVGKLLEVLQAHTPFVCRAFNWPTAHPGMDILLELEGYCRGAILWGLSAFDVRPSEGDPR